MERQVLEDAIAEIMEKLEEMQQRMERIDNRLRLLESGSVQVETSLMEGSRRLDEHEDAVRDMRATIASVLRVWDMLRERLW